MTGKQLKALASEAADALVELGRKARLSEEDRGKYGLLKRRLVSVCAEVDGGTLTLEEDLAGLVARMRRFQRAYFKGQHRGDLEKAKELEREVDRTVGLEPVQKGLFSGPLERKRSVHEIPGEAPREDDIPF